MKLTILILVAVILSNLAQGAIQYAKPFMQPDTDAVSREINRCTKVSADLPARCMVGYVADGEVKKTTDVPGGKQVMLELSAYLRFIKAQYAIAPRLLIHETSPDLVIGNFLKENNIQESTAQLSLEPVKDYGDGLILYRHH